MSHLFRGIYGFSVHSAMLSAFRAIFKSKTHITQSFHQMIYQLHKYHEWIGFGFAKSFNTTNTSTMNTSTTFMRFALSEASPLFAKSDMIGKRMKRIERIRTDCDSPSARPFPPQAE